MSNKYMIQFREIHDPSGLLESLKQRNWWENVDQTEEELKEQYDALQSVQITMETIGHRPRSQNYSDFCARGRCLQLNYDSRSEESPVVSWSFGYPDHGDSDSYNPRTRIDSREYGQFEIKFPSPVTDSTGKVLDFTDEPIDFATAEEPTQKLFMLYIQQKLGVIPPMLEVTPQRGDRVRYLRSENGTCRRILNDDSLTYDQKKEKLIKEWTGDRDCWAWAEFYGVADRVETRSGRLCVEVGSFYSNYQVLDENSNVKVADTSKALGVVATIKELCSSNNCNVFDEVIAELEVSLGKNE